jgi:hypothetical protein
MYTSVNHIIYPLGNNNNYSHPFSISLLARAEKNTKIYSSPSLIRTTFFLSLSTNQTFIIAA